MRLPVTALLVSRVAIFPLLAARLIDELQAHWSAYAARSMPREVAGDAMEEEEENGV